MIGEIIAIGNELTSGRVLNTNSRFAAGQLFTAGHEIFAMATVGDSPQEIGSAIKRAISRSDFLIVTGGLGATSDDLTNEAVSSAFGRQTVLYEDIFRRILASKPKIPGQNVEQLEKLAWLPEGAEILNPEARMAGYLLVHDGKPIFFLPGVPREMQELLANRVIPRLALWKSGTVRHVLQRVYKIFGLSETEINARVGQVGQGNSQVRVGYYPVFPEVHLSLTVTDPSAIKAGQVFSHTAAAIESVLADSIFAVDGETMESVVGNLLRRAACRLAVAESCTGGLVSQKITAVPGSSDYFVGGVVAYSNALKERLLGVDPVLLAAHGAVSIQAAIAMAEGIRRLTSTDLALAVTGIAGPGGGSRDKPVGTVYIALASDAATMHIRCQFSGDRLLVQEMSAVTALDLLRRHLLAESPRQ